ncbi:MAG: hypothetical protein Q8L38_06640, partial [Pseudohongiella sp.]|nr:hypothetical protein [Pseudohongiella sp.]
MSKSKKPPSGSQTPGSAQTTTAPIKVMTGLQVYTRLLSYMRPYIGVFCVCILGYIIYAASQAAVAP